MKRMGHHYWVGLIGVLSVLTSILLGSSEAFAATEEYNYVGQGSAYTLDGNAMSFPTVYVRLSDRLSTSQSYIMRTEVWGTTQAENYLNTTGQDAVVRSVVLANQIPSGSPAQLLNNPVPVPTSGNAVLNDFNWIIGAIPYTYGTISALIQAMNVGNIQEPVGASYQYIQENWNNVSSNFVTSGGIPNGVPAYVMRVGINAIPGDQVEAAGSITYSTLYYDLQTNSYVTFFDSTGDAYTTGPVS